jgi:hypothetical protein
MYVMRLTGFERVLSYDKISESTTTPQAMAICHTLLYLNSIASLLPQPSHQLDLPLVPVLPLDPVHLLVFIETPKRVQAANSGVKRPTQVFLPRVAVA